MSDTNGRRPGPWDAAAPRHEPEVVAARRDGTPAPAAHAPLDKGQHPAVAIGATLLFIGFLWWITDSLLLAMAVIFGLVVHEYGHVLAMNRLGCGPAKIYIIPFLGGVARSQRLPTSEWDGVLISLAGPAFGLLATLPFFALFMVLRDPIWILAAFLICMINLINLAPAPPLDGSKALGPVLSRIHPLVEKAAMLAVGAVVIVWALTRGSYIFGIFVALALFGHLSRRIRLEYGRPLSGAESLRSVGLFTATALACVGVAIGAVTLLTGDPVHGWRQVLAYFGAVQ